MHGEEGPVGIEEAVGNSDVGGEGGPEGKGRKGSETWRCVP